MALGYVLYPFCTGLVRQQVLDAVGFAEFLDLHLGILLVRHGLQRQKADEFALLATDGSAFPTAGSRSH